MSTREDRGVKRPSRRSNAGAIRRSSTDSGIVRRSSVDGGADTRASAANISSSGAKDTSVSLPGPVTSFFIILFAILLGGYFLSPIRAVPIRDIVIVDLTSSFELNTKLAEGKRFPMFAPESIVEDQRKNLYAGLRDGRVVKIVPSVFGKIGEGEMEVLNDGQMDWDATTGDISHGIPLGLRLRSNTLFVMDAIYGLYTIDLATKRVKMLLHPNSVKPGMKFPNDLDITADGKVIYFTDSSYRFPITKLIYEALEGTCTGRLFSFNLDTNELRTIAAELCFPNGVQLTNNEKALIVAETTRYRVSWIDIASGTKKHKLALPAMPDNVRRNKQGTHWICASAKLTPPLRFLFDKPFLRQLIVGLVPSSVILRIPNREHNMIFEVNDQGEIYSTMHDPHGNLTYALSQATELSDGRVALGSYAAPYLAISVEL